MQVKGTVKGNLLSLSLCLDNQCADNKDGKSEWRSKCDKTLRLLFSLFPIRYLSMDSSDSLRWVMGINNALSLVFVSDFSEKKINLLHCLDVSFIMFGTSYYIFNVMVFKTVYKISLSG